MSFLFKRYVQVLQKWPVSVQAIQAGTLMGVGDVIAQTFVEGHSVKNLNWKRTFQFASVGFIMVGPPLRIWYGYLDKVISAHGKLFAVKKMALDQLTFAPIFMAVIMSSICVAQGQSLHDIRTRLSQDYKDVLIANYKVWPAVQLCNFYLVPLHYQVLAVQVVAVFWNTYLSWKTNSELKDNSD